MSAQAGAPYSRGFALAGPVSLWSVRGVTLLSAASQTPLPVTQSPAAKFSPVGQIGYEISVSLQNAGIATAPFVLVTLTWYNDDSLTAVPVDSVSWYLPVTGSGSTVYPVMGHGPMRGQFMALTITNQDIGTSVTYTILLRGTSRSYARDDWRWQPGTGAAVAGYTLPATAVSQGTLVMAATGPVVNQGAAAAVRLLPLFAGRVRMAYTASGLTSNLAQVTLAPVNAAAGSPPLYQGPLTGQTPAAGNPVATTVEMSLPRDCCTLTMANFAAGGGGNATFQVVVIAEEY